MRVRVRGCESVSVYMCTEWVCMCGVYRCVYMCDKVCFILLFFVDIAFFLRVFISKKITVR